MSTPQDGLIANLSQITGMSPDEAQRYLAENEWNVQAAFEAYEYDQGEEEDEQHAAPQQPSAPSSSRQPQASSNSRQTGRNQAGRVATLGDFRSGEDDDDDEEDDKGPRDLFAGGEKSGLAVQDPSKRSGHSDAVNKILEQARNNSRAIGLEPGDARPANANFTGTARTLGGDDTPSQVIPDPNAAPARRARETVRRVLHLWADGFSVDDGPLYRADDPANTHLLDLISEGTAPLSIMNVERNQEVEVKVDHHKENYVAPKKQYKPFGGSGQRLGSETPAAGPSSSSSGTGMPGSFPSSSTTQSQSQATLSTSQAAVQVDDSQPVITLQIRLGDGSRLTSRFNTTHTVDDVYKYVASANAASAGRSYALMTTFPSKELKEKASSLGDIAELKKGGVIVQKWE